MRIAQRLAPLAAQDARAVRAAWAMRGEAAEVLRSRFNIDLDRNCFRCLRNGEWLNDEAINLYMALLQVTGGYRSRSIIITHPPCSPS